MDGVWRTPIFSQAKRGAEGRSVSCSPLILRTGRLVATGAEGAEGAESPTKTKRPAGEGEAL